MSFDDFPPVKLIVDGFLPEKLFFILELLCCYFASLLITPCISSLRNTSDLTDGLVVKGHIIYGFEPNNNLHEVIPVYSQSTYKACISE